MISLVVNAYQAQAALDRQLAQWRLWPLALRCAVEVVVVDDGSARPLAVDAGAVPQGMRLQLARIHEDIAWNMPGARNLGALLARGEWLLFHDVDHFVPADGLALLLAHRQRLDARTLYRFARSADGQLINPHINSFLCGRDGFWCAGGYDEDFAGHYGHEDSCFHGAWGARVGPQLMLTDVVLDVHPRFATQGLDRDTTHNSALFRHKAAEGFVPSRRRLRFDWSTAVLAPAVPVAAAEPALAA